MSLKEIELLCREMHARSSPLAYDALLERTMEERRAAAIACLRDLPIVETPMRFAAQHTNRHMRGQWRQIDRRVREEKDVVRDYLRLLREHAQDRRPEERIEDLVIATVIGTTHLRMEIRLEQLESLGGQRAVPIRLLLDTHPVTRVDAAEARRQFEQCVRKVRRRG